MKFENMQHVIDELGEVFFALKQDDIKIAKAQEMNNGAGKVINAVKVVLEGYALRREAPTIPFLQLAGVTSKSLPSTYANEPSRPALPKPKAAKRARA